MDEQSHELVRYFIDETNKKFERLETKVDLLLKFKWEVIGGASAVSFLVAVLVQMFFK